MISNATAEGEPDPTKKDIARHPAYKFINEAPPQKTKPQNPEQLGNEFRKKLHGAIGNGQPLSSSYTLADQITLWKGQALETLAAVGFNDYKGHAQRAREETECRVLAETIKNYRANFEQRLGAITDMQSYCRTTLDQYSVRIGNHSTKALEERSKIIELDDLVNILRTETANACAAAKNAPTHDARVTAAKYAAKQQHDYHSARRTMNELKETMNENTRMTKVYTVLHSSMDERYGHVIAMASILRQSGTHLDHLLQEYENGASSIHVVLLRETIKQCNFSLNEVNELNAKYRIIEEEAANMQTLTGVKLEDEYTKALKNAAAREEQRFKERNNGKDDAINTALG